MSLEAIQSDKYITIIKIVDRFDIDCHAEFRAAYIAAPAGSDYIVDLEQASYVDAAALGMLLLLRDHVQQHGGQLWLRNSRDRVSDLLRIANFQRLFRIQ
jgi:anti-anti-sigma factor